MNETKLLLNFCYLVITLSLIDYVKSKVAYRLLKHIRRSKRKYKRKPSLKKKVRK